MFPEGTGQGSRRVIRAPETYFLTPLDCFIPMSHEGASLQERRASAVYREDSTLDISFPQRHHKVVQAVQRTPGDQHDPWLRRPNPDFAHDLDAIVPFRP